MIEILKQLREVAVPGKTRVVVIDGVLQYACAVSRNQVPGTDDIVFEGFSEKREVPSGLLSNLGRAEARNYFLDLTCGRPPHRYLDYNFLIRLQDAGEAQWVRAYVGGPHPRDGGERMENQEGILSSRKQSLSCSH